jgi:hypothetical protein
MKDFDMTLKKHLEKILQQMCKYVNVDRELIDTKQEDWFLQHSWTEKQQNNFKRWLINYLKTHKDAREVIMKFPSSKIADIKAVAVMFIFEFGWKLKNE